MNNHEYEKAEELIKENQKEIRANFPWYLFDSVYDMFPNATPEEKEIAKRAGEKIRKLCDDLKDKGIKFKIIKYRGSNC